MFTYFSNTSITDRFNYTYANLENFTITTSFRNLNALVQAISIFLAEKTKKLFRYKCWNIAGYIGYLYWK